jgi:hypothetical protein
MALFLSTTIATGQVISGDQVRISSVLLTAGAADAVVKLYSNGVEQIRLAAKAGTSAEYPSGKGGNDFNCPILTTPITLDLSGAGAFARVAY